jgi:hypothetical protein
MLTHSKGDRILSMAAGAGAISLRWLGDSFNGDKAITRYQAHSETPTHMGIAPLIIPSRTLKSKLNEFLKALEYLQQGHTV